VTPFSWPCPAAGGGISPEYALTFDRERVHRVLVVPALFDEANRMRRFTVEVMRRLDGAGLDCFLPDLPGTNESLARLQDQTVEGWQHAVMAAAAHFRATHVLGIRGGCLIVPESLPGWLYGPVKGASILRQMMRARIVSSREAGREETTAGLTEMAGKDGIDLAGHRMGAELFAQFNEAQPVSYPILQVVEQATLGGSPLWLRAEPDEDAAQADALAAIVAIGVKA
jgi:hypothetical protein